MPPYVLCNDMRTHATCARCSQRFRRKGLFQGLPWLKPSLRLHKMPAVKKKELKTHSRYSPFLRGVIYGMFLAGSSQRDIVDELTKSDGSPVSQPGVCATIQMVEANGGVLWDGEVKPGPCEGRPRATTKALDRKILRLVFRMLSICSTSSIHAYKKRASLCKRSMCVR